MMFHLFGRKKGHDHRTWVFICFATLETCEETACEVSKDYWEFKICPAPCVREGVPSK